MRTHQLKQTVLALSLFTCLLCLSSCLAPTSKRIDRFGSWIVEYTGEYPDNGTVELVHVWKSGAKERYRLLLGCKGINDKRAVYVTWKNRNAMFAVWKEPIDYCSAYIELGEDLLLNQKRVTEETARGALRVANDIVSNNKIVNSEGRFVSKTLSKEDQNPFILVDLEFSDALHRR
jgi:hypothetical protein